MYLPVLWVGCGELWGWLCPDEGGAEVSPRALGGAGGWQGWSFWLAGSWGLESASEEVSQPKAQPVAWDYLKFPKFLKFLLH